MQTRPLFEPKDYVRRKSQPDKSGVVKECLRDEQVDGWRYLVIFGGPPARDVPESDLQLVPEEIDPWDDLVQGRHEGADAYQKLLTFERLNRPPSRVAESFGVARAKLFPYQFKPLLKFLDSGRQRLLIADDVGLGKTIEAGYILKELKARHGVERCLIVVPARLRTKWQREMADRFDEWFELVRAADIRTRLLDRIESGREPDPFLWITSYESVRDTRVAKGFADLQPQIDLVVFDEAHRVRNAATLQNRAAHALSSCADALLLLTATPVQTSEENLFQLFRLLDAESFVNYQVFLDQLRANAPVVRALGKLRAATSARLTEAVADLRQLADHPVTASIADEEFFADLLRRVEEADPSDRRALVELQRDIGELSLTSGLISRTRKVQVMRDRPERQAQSVKVKLSPQERSIYDEVERRFLDKTFASSWGQSMALLQALRLTASCIPAAVDYFRSRRDEAFDADVSDDDDSGQYSRADAQDATRGLPKDAPSGDSKLDALLRVLEQPNASGKVVVFAFFKSTLRYLSTRLDDHGIRHRLIHGDVSIEEREARIEEFVRDETIHVLLSSEVGSEGVDLQVASAVVNYDLPWNPMVVEQRIGRIDRIGQKARVLSIVNLVVDDTVEDRILLRLYERIDLFRNTVGEIEDILGEQVQDLVLKYLSGELTPEQAEMRAIQQAEAFIAEQQQAAALQAQADVLLASDQAFLDEVESLFGECRLPSPGELYRYVKRFLDDRYPGCRFPHDLVERSVEVRLQPQVGTDLLARFPGEADVKRFAARLQGGGVMVTMDSDAYLRVGSAEFVSMHHCLVRLAREEMRRTEETLHRTFGVSLSRREGLREGVYVMGVTEMEVGGIRPRIELTPVAMRVGSKQPLRPDDARKMFVAALEESDTWEGGAPCDEQPLRQAIDRVRAETRRLRKSLEDSEATLGDLRAARRRATLEATLRQRVKAAKERLSKLKSQDAKPFAIRMATSKHEVEQGRLKAFLDATRPGQAAVVAPRDVAAVLVVVEEEQA